MQQVEIEREHEPFAELVRKAEAGESLTSVKAGKPVARLIPFAEETPVAVSEAERQAAWDRLQAVSEKGFDLGIVWNGRDELYDRD